jgi:hypothetical protein
MEGEFQLCACQLLPANSMRQTHLKVGGFIVLKDREIFGAFGETRTPDHLIKDNWAAPFVAPQLIHYS